MRQKNKRALFMKYEQETSHQFNFDETNNILKRKTKQNKNAINDRNQIENLSKIYFQELNN